MDLAAHEMELLAGTTSPVHGNEDGYQDPLIGNAMNLSLRPMHTSEFGSCGSSACSTLSNQTGAEGLFLVPRNFCGHALAATEYLAHLGSGASSLDGDNVASQDSESSTGSMYSLSQPLGGKRRRDHDFAVPMLENEDPIRGTILRPDLTVPHWPSFAPPYEPFQDPRSLGLGGIVGLQSQFTYPTPAASPKQDFAALALGRNNQTWKIPSIESKAETSRPAKRTRQPFPLEENSNINSSQSLERKPPLEHKREPTSLTFLACPFYKRDRHKHHDCLKYELRRVKDVKQHIYRKHMNLEFSCPRCPQQFSTAKLRDRHRREPQCKKEPSLHSDGISEEQRNSLNITASRGQSPEEQWFNAWDIVFPDEPRPTSCYLGNYIQEIMSQLRDFWNRKGSEIGSRVLDDTHANTVNQGTLNSMIGTIFSQFESEMSTPAIEEEATTPMAASFTSHQHIEPANSKSEQLSYEPDVLLEGTESFFEYLEL